MLPNSPTRLETVLTMLAQSPADSFLLFAAAKEYEKIGDNTQALHYYLRLRDTNPDYVGLYYHLGKLYEVMQQQPQALEAYAVGIDVAKRFDDRHALAELETAQWEAE